MAAAATLAGMATPSRDPRGARIKKRIDEMAVDVNRLADAAGVARDTVYNAMKGTASPKSYRRIELALDQMATPTGDAIMVTPTGLVEFEVTIDALGIDVVVKGPVENADALREQVQRLIGEIRGAGGSAN